MNQEALAASLFALSQVMDNLDGSSKQFAADLLKQGNQRGYLSDKQLYWVAKLTEKGNKPALPPHPTEKVGDFEGVFKLFAKAQAKLKYPKITLEVDGFPVALQPSMKSKHGEIVNVTDGKPYGQNLWFGRVSKDGVYTQNSFVPEERAKPVRRLLQAMSQDPAKTAKEYGRLTGRCCFCNSKLTDEKSTAAGFGPVCAANYGLADEWKAAVATLES